MTDFNASRPQVSVYVAASLDGFIAGENGELDWLQRVEAEGEDYGYQTFFESVDTLILGRGTFDKVLGFDAWPFSGKRVVVLTHREVSAPEGVVTHGGQLRPLLQELANWGARHVYLDGGQAIRQGLAEDLVDNLTISWIPLLLGRGIPLFRGLDTASDWALGRHQGYPTGLVQVTYRRQR